MGQVKNCSLRKPLHIFISYSVYTAFEAQDEKYISCYNYKHGKYAKATCWGESVYSSELYKQIHQKEYVTTSRVL